MRTRELVEIIFLLPKGLGNLGKPKNFLTDSQGIYRLEK